MVRRVVGVVTLCMAVVALLPVAGTHAQAAAPAVTVDKDGWWNRTQGGADPVISPTPLGGVVPAIPKSPTIPDDSLPVSATSGEPQTVVGIGIAIDAPQGSTVNRLVMHLALAEGDGAEQNAGSAAIRACPITSFWGATENGKYADAPEADCEQGVDGKRNDDGTWTFDLTSIGSLWLDQFGTLAQNGVLLVENVEPPGTFQVAFAKPPDGVRFDADITAAAAEEDPFDLGGGAGSTGGFDSGGGSTTPPLDLGAEPTIDAGPPAVEVPTTEAPAPEQAREVAAPVADSRNVGRLGGNLPIALVLLVPLALVLALAAGRATGPVPATARVRRQGGIGRVLSARRHGGARPTSRPVSETP